jgi:hypothetical protein
MKGDSTRAAELAVEASGQFPAALTAGDDGRSCRGEGAAQAGDRRVSRDVQDEVVRAGVCEVLTGVVDDVVGAEGTDKLDLAGTADSGDLRTEGFGQLDRVAADAAGRSGDKHLLPFPDLSGAQAQESSDRGDRHRRGLLEGEALGLRGQFGLGCNGVFRVGATAASVHGVADGEPRDVWTYGFYGSCEIQAENPSPLVSGFRMRDGPGRAGRSSCARLRGRRRPP